MSDTPASQRDTLSSASKKYHGLRANCYVVHRTKKAKSVLLPFKKGPAPRVDNPFFNKYPMPELEMGEEEILFRPD